MKYFKSREFDSPDLPGSGQSMDADFMTMLESARESAEIPFRITSGFRTSEHNTEVGGKPGSAHLKGKAADIEAITGETKFKIVRAAIASGIRRIGIAKTFIHVDNDGDLPNPTIWLY